MAETERPPELDTVTVEYPAYGRAVTCFCGKQIPRSIVPHLKAEHTGQWNEWTATFVKLRGRGYALKRIMRLFRAGDNKLLFSWTVVERAIRKEVETGAILYTPPPKKRVINWHPNNFGLERTTLWDFPRRGDWAVHSSDYRGNWAPAIPRNLILQYTREGDLVVDAFVGGGTTLIEAWLLGRPSIGLDLSKLAIQTATVRLNEMEQLARGDDRVCLKPELRPKVIEGNALELTSVLMAEGVGPGQVKLVCAHPPYLDSLPYTGSNPDDLALLTDPSRFFDAMRRFALEARTALRPDGVCAILIGDVRKRGKTVPLGLRTLDSFLAIGFEVDDIVVKTQHRDRSSEFYMGRSNGRLLLAHEYLFILRNKSLTTSTGWTPAAILPE